MKSDSVRSDASYIQDLLSGKISFSVYECYSGHSWLAYIRLYAIKLAFLYDYPYVLPQLGLFFKRQITGLVEYGGVWKMSSALFECVNAGAWFVVSEDSIRQGTAHKDEPSLGLLSYSP